jgi:hypothetical protein
LESEEHKVSVSIHDLKKLARESMRRISFHNKTVSSIVARIKYYAQNSEVEELIQTVYKAFKGEEATLDWKRDRTFILDYLYCREYYAITYKEYFLFGLDKSHDDTKKDFLGWLELGNYDLELNKSGHPEIFESKEKAYESFKEYYGREVIAIFSESQKKLAATFFARHSAGIVKPFDEYGGHGIEIYKVSSDTTFEQIWKEISLRCPFVLEELIDQAPEMSNYYPLSVNTIRYNTFYLNGELTRLQAVLRMGMGGSFVDNASSGGIYALVDIDTGRVIGPARDFKGECFEKHPDTGVQIKGSIIPRWDELNKMLESIVCVIPDQKQVGWDFALSKAGWVMVEGNTTPVLQDFDLEHGLRKQITELYSKVIPVWK